MVRIEWIAFSKAHIIERGPHSHYEVFLQPDCILVFDNGVNIIPMKGKSFFKPALFIYYDLKHGQAIGWTFSINQMVSLKIKGSITVKTSPHKNPVIRGH